MKLNPIFYFLIISGISLLTVNYLDIKSLQPNESLKLGENSKLLISDDIDSSSKKMVSESCNADFKIGNHGFQFSGGMRFDSRKFGDGNVSFATPVIAIDENKVWIGGETNKIIVGAFELVFSKSRQVEDMPIAKNIVPFKKVDKLTGWETHKRLSGIDKVQDNILIGLTEYYDAMGDAPFSHAVLDKDLNLSGWYKTDAVQIAHTSGWIQALPEKWSQLLNATHLMGNTENYPIARRHSNGPSLYLWDGNISATMQVTPKLYYTLQKPLHELRYNREDVLFTPLLRKTLPKTVGDNDLWTVESQAWGGFVRGDDYIVFGASGMHHSSGGYKITDKDGNKCGGPCAYDPNDYYNHYWVYNMYDILNARHPWDPKPYEWGKLKLGFAEKLIYGSNANGLIKGVDYDGTYLYLTIKNGDTSRTSQRLPLLLRYQICNVK